MRSFIKFTGFTHSFGFSTYHQAKILAFEFFYNENFKTGLNITYNFGKMRFADTVFFYSQKIFHKFNLLFSACLLKRSINLSFSRKFEKPSKSKVGLFLESTNMGHGIDFVGKIAGKYQIDKSSYIRTILSSDLSVATQFHITSQDFLSMDFFAKISNSQNQFGGVFHFYLLNFQ